MFKNPLQIIKIIACTCVILTFILIAYLGKLLTWNKQLRRSFYVHNTTFFCRMLLKVMGIKLSIKNPENLNLDKNYLILSNHMSYLDGLLLSALTPLCFVTSIEMKNTFFLGLLTELGGCLYVERRSRDKLGEEIGEISHALDTGFSVVVFPEATSTNGSAILPFKRSLLKSAIDTGKPILPLCINYEKIDGEAVNTKSRNMLCWYGEMTFVPHFFSMMWPTEIEISITVQPEIPVCKDSTRDVLIEKAYEAITKDYKKII